MDNKIVNKIGHQKKKKLFIPKLKKSNQKIKFSKIITSKINNKRRKKRVKMEQNASKKLWKTDNEILEVNVTETISNIKNDAGEVMTNPEDITEYFNNFFVNIGKKLARKKFKSHKNKKFEF